MSVHVYHSAKCTSVCSLWLITVFRVCFVRVLNYLLKAMSLPAFYFSVFLPYLPASLPIKCFPLSPLSSSNILFVLLFPLLFPSLSRVSVLFLCASTFAFNFPSFSLLFRPLNNMQSYFMRLVQGNLWPPNPTGGLGYHFCSLSVCVSRLLSNAPKQNMERAGKKAGRSMSSKGIMYLPLLLDSY